jgi:PPP family 3-phenylpropionic acid transporter
MNTAPEGGAYWRLSSFYFLYFACLGVLMPYWSLYLEAIGLEASAIGVVLAAMAATRIVGPNCWGWLADRSGRRVEIIRIATVLAALCFAGLFPGITFGWLVLVVVLHTFFWNAILAQYEAITLASLGSAVHRYGQVRLWGSVSFVLAVLAAGLVFDRVSVAYLPWVMLPPLALLAAGSFAIRDPGAGMRDREGAGFRELLRSRVLWAFSLLLDRHGYTRVAIGWMWALGVLAEVVLFAFAHRLLTRFDLRQVLLGSLLLAVARWLMIAFATSSPVMLALAQCLHAATFGSFHAAGVELVRRHFGPQHGGQGQALYSAFSFGAGGALGALASGALWEVQMHLGFVLAAIASLAGWWVVRAEVRGPLVARGEVELTRPLASSRV